MKFKSPVYTQVSGSIGGLTYAQNAGGLYSRARAIPVNPNTPLQQQARDALKAAASYWTNTLTAQQRADWDAFAVENPVIDRLGSPITVSGQNWFIRTNQPRIYNGLAIQVLPPASGAELPWSVTGLGIVSGLAAVDVSFNESDGWPSLDDTGLLIQVSRPVSPAVNYFRGPWIGIEPILGDSTTPPSSPASINLPFTPQSGDKVFLRARLSPSGGVLTSASDSSVIVA